MWHDRAVPPILLSGHHVNVEKWRRKQSILRTRRRRPDLYEKLDLSSKEDRKLLAELEDLEPEKRSACFVSAVCFCLPDGRHFTYMGRCPGWVGLEPVGENGFGYDPIFIPDEVGTADGKCLPNEENRSYAQLQDWEKDAISHRGRALRLMQAKLADDLAVKA